MRSSEHARHRKNRGDLPFYFIHWYYIIIICIMYSYSFIYGYFCKYDFLNAPQTIPKYFLETLLTQM